MFFRPFFFYASPLVLMTPFLVVVLWLLIKTLKDVFFKNSRPGKYRYSKLKQSYTQDAFFGTTIVWFYSPSLFSGLNIKRRLQIFPAASQPYYIRPQNYSSPSSGPPTLPPPNNSSSYPPFRSNPSIVEDYPPPPPYEIAIKNMPKIQV